ncbi:sulfite exporter TauE/SafE family protein [soil metagenome]
MATSLLVVGCAAAAGGLQHFRDGHVRWRTAVLFGLAGTVTSFAGAAVSQRLDERWVLLGFAALMVVVALRMLQESRQRAPENSSRDPEPGWRRRLPQILGAGALVGFLTGLFGVGGGFIVVPALVFLLGLEMPVAVGTSLLVVVLNSGAGFVAHLGTARLDSSVAGSFAVAGLVGSVAGGRLTRRVEAGRLSRWFGYLVLAVAAFVVWQVLVSGGESLG